MTDTSTDNSTSHLYTYHLLCSLALKCFCEGSPWGWLLLLVETRWGVNIYVNQQMNNYFEINIILRNRVFWYAL